MKKILVTGGCGFVGRHLIKRLVDESPSEIWIVDDLSTGRGLERWEYLHPRIAVEQRFEGATTYTLDHVVTHLIFIKADFLSLAYGELGRQPVFGLGKLPRFDEIYHLASVVGGRALIDGDPLAVGVDLAIDSVFFLWAAKVNLPGRILYASSSAAYPTSKQTFEEAIALSEEIIDFERGFSKPDYTYGWSKLTGEYLAIIASKIYGLKVAVVRPFSGYGEDQDISYPVPAIAMRVAARLNPVLVWGSGLQGRDFIYIEDCIEACILACRNISDGSAINIGSGKLVSFLDLAKTMIKIEGCNSVVQGMDNRPVGVAQRYSNTIRMLEVLGWTPRITIEEGLKRVLRGAHRRLENGVLPPS